MVLLGITKLSTVLRKQCDSLQLGDQFKVNFVLELINIEFLLPHKINIVDKKYNLSTIYDVYLCTLNINIASKSQFVILLIMFFFFINSFIGHIFIMFY